MERGVLKSIYYCGRYANLSGEEGNFHKWRCVSAFSARQVDRHSLDLQPEYLQETSNTSGTDFRSSVTPHRIGEGATVRNMAVAELLSRQGLFEKVHHH